MAAGRRGRPCLICSDGSKTRIAAEMIAAGASDRAIGEKLGVGRMAANRHRITHVMAPARALVEAASKDAPAKEKRAEIARAIEAGDDVAAFVSLAGIVSDLRVVHARLERTASAAEAASQPLAVASLSSQQLRSADLRAKLGGAGAYAPKARGDGDGAVPFSVVIHLGDKTQRLDLTPVENGPHPPTIDMPDRQPEGDTTTVVRLPGLQRLGAGFYSRALSPRPGR
jgi:hypothetical protein